MIDMPVYNCQGKQVDTIQFDEAVLGTKVRPALLKQAIVMYHANRRVGTAATKSRGMVSGSTRKIYRQKGTGRARMGTVRTGIRTGGGVAFAKAPRDFRLRMPQKQRRLARDSAILAKIHSDDAVVLDKLQFEQPKTREFVAILDKLKIDRTCLVALDQQDENVLKSLRNINRVSALLVDQLNAGDICRSRRLLFTRAALEMLLDKSRSEAAAVPAVPAEPGAEQESDSSGGGN